MSLLKQISLYCQTPVVQWTQRKERKVKYKVFTNTKQGRTMIDTWTTEDNKTLADLVRVYDDEYAKVDVFTDEGTFVRSVYLSPDGTDTLITPAEGTILVAAVEGYIERVGA